MLFDDIRRLSRIFEQIVQFPLGHGSRSIIVTLPLLAWIVNELEAIVIERS